MTNDPTHILTHWRYYLALESDLLKISRYVEFHPSNNNTYSIELAHLFITSCSEIDVLAKVICNTMYSSSKASNIVQYRDEILKSCFSIVDESVYINRFNYIFTPFGKWIDVKSPDWWSDHQKVKHKRDQHFNKANLLNTLMAMGGLLILNIYSQTLKNHGELQPKNISYTIQKLEPMSSLLTLDRKYYPVHR